MNDKTKRKFSAQLLYVILAILVLSIVCIAIAVSLTGGNQADTPATLPATDPQPPQTQSPPSTSTPDSGTVGGEPEKLIFQIPVQGVISQQHDEDLLVFSPTMEDYRTHIGIDVTANVGTAVCAVAKGTVKHIYTDPFMGVSVVIDHGDGLQSVYQNLSETLPEGLTEGISVSAGYVIGAIGETASREIAQEPHLHFELLRNDEPLDPLDYLTYDQQVSGGYED